MYLSVFKNINFHCINVFDDADYYSYYHYYTSQSATYFSEYNSDGLIIAMY